MKHDELYYMENPTHVSHKGEQMKLPNDLNLRAKDAENEVTRLLDLLDTAWVIIANTGSGNWERERPEWRQAAIRWRDDFHAALTRHRK